MTLKTFKNTKKEYKNLMRKYILERSEDTLKKLFYEYFDIYDFSH